MRFAAFLLLLSASIALSAAGAEKAYVGKLLKVEKHRIELDRAGNTIYIGFVGDSEVLRSLDEVKVGDEVLAIFGSTLTAQNLRSINKLLSIRGCTPSDQECAAARASQEAQRNELLKELAMADEEHARCREAMKNSLVSDSRYVPPAEVSAPVPNDDLSKFNALTGKKRTCANKLVENHRAAVFAACKHHRCGENIGGGCAHGAGYSVNSSVFKKALEKCAK